MGEAITRPTAVAVGDFLDSVEPERRRAEGRALDALFRRVTGWEPAMWGPSIVGYGRYAYTYESGHSGEMCATGFSPRKANLVLYILPGYADFGHVLARLGKHRMGKSCLYLNRLEDADEAALEELIGAGLSDLGRRWPLLPR
jgi:hypothetical protein